MNSFTYPPAGDKLTSLHPGSEGHRGCVRRAPPLGPRKPGRGQEKLPALVDVPFPLPASVFDEGRCRLTTTEVIDAADVSTIDVHMPIPDLPAAASISLEPRRPSEVHPVQRVSLPPLAGACRGSS